MLTYSVKLLNGQTDTIQCYEAIVQEGFVLFRNASGQVTLAVPSANIAFIKLDEN